MELRPYQREAVEAVERKFNEGFRSALLCLPTGTGKTIVFSEISRREVWRGGRVLILAHRGELLTQAKDKLLKATGILAGVEKAEETAQAGADGLPYSVVVGSVQSMCNPNRLERFAHDEFDLIVIDECHHALADTYRRVLEWFDKARLLGVTATPDRGDERGLESVFEVIAYDYSIVQAIRDKYLSPILAKTIPLDLDIRGVATSGGDFQVHGLGSALEPYLEQIAQVMGDICKARKTVVFTPLIATSRHLLPLVELNGLEVREVNGESKDRKELVEWFDKAPAGSVLLNSMLLTEGWDCPSCDCVIVLRPTRVRALYCQMVGRGARLFPAKENLLLLDFLWLTSTHELCRPASLIGAAPDVEETLTEDVNGSPDGILLDDESIEKAKSETVQKREDSLAKKLEELRRRKGQLVDPLQYAFSIADADLSGYKPRSISESSRPTMEQVTMLEKLGFGAPDTTGEAAKLLETYRKREAQGLSSPKQIRFLERKGFRNVGTWKFAEARRMINRLAALGWNRMPAGVDPATYRPQEAS